VNTEHLPIGAGPPDLQNSDGHCHGQWSKDQPRRPEQYESTDNREESRDGVQLEPAARENAARLPLRP
jgi:hypothetical protein